MTTTQIEVYANKAGPSWPEIELAVKDANGLQTHFSFQLSHLDRLSKTATDDVPIKRFEKKIAAEKPAILGIVFCEHAFENGGVVREILPHRIYVSCRVTTPLYAPPFRLYVLYQLGAAALTLSAKLSDTINHNMIHDPPIGCLWDWWKTADQRSAAMVTARICPACRNALHLHGQASLESIAATQQILDYIRRRMMGETPEIANRVFIAYGHGQDWLELKTLLEGWKLSVEFFNRTPVAGVVTTERWREMLNRSRFAFAVMTPDDELVNGKKRARQNVIHEIGLCHARLGLRNTAILLAEGTEKFTNVDGVSYLSFAPGKLLAKKETIKALLEERGLL